MSSTRLTDRFREIIELQWTEFRELEIDPHLSNFDAAVCSLVRACVKGNLTAIRHSLDRIDGPVVQEVEVIMPKFYTLYPNAKEKIGGTEEVTLSKPNPNKETPQPTEEEEIPSGSLRAVLDKMLEADRRTVDVILASALAIDSNNPTDNNPFVKSVIVAGLFGLIHKGKFEAVMEIFEQVDGKIRQSYQLLGGDIYLTSFAEVAPAGAILNENGVYQVENEQATTLWGERLDGKRRLRG